MKSSIGNPVKVSLWNPVSETRSRYRHEIQYRKPGQGIVMKSSIGNQVSWIGPVRQFCSYQYFCIEILFYLVSFSSQILSKRMFRPQKRNSGVSHNNTFINFGLWATLLLFTLLQLQYSLFVNKATVVPTMFLDYNIIKTKLDYST